ncbi:hypothetical protein ACHAWF_008039 [Thalassiosira exigua]
MSDDMTTPPSSPPFSPDLAGEPPSLVDTTSLSLSPDQQRGRDDRPAQGNSRQRRRGSETPPGPTGEPSAPPPVVASSRIEGRGHARTTTPSTPLSAASAGSGSGSGGEGGGAGGSLPRAPRIFSTPGRCGPPRPSSGSGGSHSGAGGQPHPLALAAGLAHPPHPLVSDLTPVISNAAYVESPSSSSAASGGRPGMPGLPESFASETGRLSSRASDLLGEDSEGSAFDRSFDRSFDEDAARSGSSSRSSGAPRGLRQRPFPLPRAGLPPSKREGRGDNAPPAPSVAARTSSSDSSQLKVSPPTPLSAGTSLVLSSGSQDLSGMSGNLSQGLASPDDCLERLHSAGSGLLGERLSMPSCGSLGSDDDDDESYDESSDKPSIFKNADSASIFKTSQGTSSERGKKLAPIELRPDRKFLSFQGQGGYRSAVGRVSGGEGGDGEEATPLEAVPEPTLRRAERGDIGEEGAPEPYRPLSRGQHGAGELAERGALEAIFKPPRRRPPAAAGGERTPARAQAKTQTQAQARARVPPAAVSPQTPRAPLALATEDEEEEGAESPIVGLRGHGRSLRQPAGLPMPQVRGAFAPDVAAGEGAEGQVERTSEEGEEGGDGAVGEGGEGGQRSLLLQRPYPVESQWSIPSIRLASRVHHSGAGSVVGRDESFASLAEYSVDYDEDESYYSFLDDDDTASVSSRGSVDASARRRRIGELIRKSSRGTEGADEEASSADHRPSGVFVPKAPLLRQSTAPAVVAAASDPSVPSAFPGVAPSDSFVEKVGGITLGGPAEASAEQGGRPDALLADDEPYGLVPPPVPLRARTFDLAEWSDFADATEGARVLRAVDRLPDVAADDDLVDYDDARPPARRRRRRDRRGRERARREGTALRWLAEVQGRTYAGGVEASGTGGAMGGGGIGGAGATRGGGGGTALIAEAASSRFLAGEGGSGGDEDVAATSLGMPHPLCRSSTIEAGPFVVRAAAAAAPATALTSSGSGD